MLKRVEVLKISAARDNPQILAEVMDSLWQPIFRFAFKRTLDIERARQVTQKTLVELVSQIKTFRPVDEYSLSVLAYQIAIKEIGRQPLLFKRKKLTSIDFGTDNLSYIKTELDNATKEIEAAGNLREAREVLSIIDDKYKDAVILYYLEQASLEEISRILNKNLNNIKAMLSKSIGKLEDKYRIEVSLYR